MTLRSIESSVRNPSNIMITSNVRHVSSLLKFTSLDVNTDPCVCMHVGPVSGTDFMESSAEQIMLQEICYRLNDKAVVIVT